MKRKGAAIFQKRGSGGPTHKNAIHNESGQIWSSIWTNLEQSPGKIVEKVVGLQLQTILQKMDSLIVRAFAA